jgi:hypothetical protein
MRAGFGARSVAIMRPSPLSLAATVGATVAALTAVAPAQGADAVFGGTASHAAPIVVTADAKFQTLKSVAISWFADCADGNFYDGNGRLTPAEAAPGFAPGPRELLVSRNAKGRFEGQQLLALQSDTHTFAVVVKVAGKLTAKRARGTLSAIVKIGDRATGNEVTSCQTSGSWTATRSPGVIFGGTTAQDQPIVLRSADGTAVDDVITAWRSSCAPSGFFSGPAHWGGFAVKRTGSFGAPFSSDRTLQDGTKVHYDYALAGRLPKAGAAKGTLQVKVASTDPAGTVTACDSGNVTWKATTG